MEEEEIQEELVERYAFVVDKGQSALRIDKYIHDKIQNISRNRIQNACKTESVLVNGKVVKSNYKVKPSDKISILVAKTAFGPNKVEPQDIPLDIHFEDDDILIINKPAGMVVHPGIANSDGTLVNALKFYLDKEGPIMEGNDPDRAFLVHRIDKDTSGLLVVAKNDFALSKLAKQFFDHTIDREYWALVWGNFDEPKGTIEANIGRHPRFRNKQYVYKEGESGKHAITHYEVMEDMYYVSLVKCVLETGRTHQIRVHMQSENHPLFSDAKYGGDKIIKGTVFTKYKQFVQNCFKVCTRQALHAQKLAFTHPRTEERVTFEVDPPEDITDLLNKWRHYLENRKTIS